MDAARQGTVGVLALLAATTAAIFGLALEGQGPAAGSPLAAGGSNANVLLAPGIERAPRVARRVEAIRELEFDRVPKPQVGDVVALGERVERELARPRVQRSLAAAQAELRLLGLLAADQELGAVAGDVTALAAAYYDVRTKDLVLVADAVPAGAALAEFVIAHELTHALEDQRFGLPAATGVTDDRALARNALIEGSAGVVMARYAVKHLNPFALAAEAAGVDAATSDLPRFAEAEIQFTYLAGERFVDSLLGVGSGWNLVDHAYTERPPATTEQILHPEKYLAGEDPLAVPTPRAPGAGWRALRTGTLGEFGTREVLRAGEPGIAADEGAAGWGGDASRLFVRRGERRECSGDCRATHALGIAWRMDSLRDTRELARGLERFLELGLGGAAAGGSAWRLPGGWAAVQARGDRAGLGLAPRRADATRLAAPSG